MNQVNVIDPRSLRRLRGLSSLTSAQLERLATAMSMKRIRRREKIFDQDDMAEKVYLLLSGIVRFSLVNQEERRVLVSLLPPGEFFGTASLFPEKRHPFASEAFSDCTIGMIDPEAFVDILMGVPLEAYLRCSELTMGRVWGMFLHCIRGIGLNLPKRLALELLELAACFGVQDSRGAILSVRPTHEDLANSIGASRQKVTECLGDFERRRIVIREGRRLVLNPRRLRQIVEKG